MVIRVNKLGELCLSKPCRECIIFLKRQCDKYKIKLSRVYYSDINIVICEKFNNLINDTNKHISKKNRINL
jgi:hypothetical protein